MKRLLEGGSQAREQDWPSECDSERKQGACTRSLSFPENPRLWSLESRETL